MSVLLHLPYFENMVRYMIRSARNGRHNQDVLHAWWLHPSHYLRFLHSTTSPCRAPSKSLGRKPRVLAPAAALTTETMQFLNTQNRDPSKLKTRTYRSNTCRRDHISLHDALLPTPNHTHRAQACRRSYRCRPRKEHSPCPTTSP